MKSHYLVVESKETGEYYVMMGGRFTLTHEWYGEGGRAESAEHVGEYYELGLFTISEIEEKF